MPDTPKRKPKTITAASKANLPRPKRRRPAKATVYEARVDCGGCRYPHTIRGKDGEFVSWTCGCGFVNAAVLNDKGNPVDPLTATPCHDPAPIDEALWRASTLPHTAPEPFDLPTALLVIRRWLADHLTTLAAAIRPNG